jgi:DNA-binding NarL/FixJ family response regulator
MASVLIIDDNQGTLDTFSTVLRLAGHIATTAATGSSGIDMALAEPFDLYLVDLKLHDMSGIDVVRKLKERNLTAPMIILTAFPDLDSSFDAAVVGAAGYVAGMLLPDELVGVVSKALQGRFPLRHPASDLWGSSSAEPQDASRIDPRITEMIRLIDSNLTEPPSAGEIAAMMHMSESRLRHLFRARVGVSVMRFAKERRLRVAAFRLTTTKDCLDPQHWASTGEACEDNG